MPAAMAPPRSPAHWKARSVCFGHEGLNRRQPMVILSEIMGAWGCGNPHRSRISLGAYSRPRRIRPAEIANNPHREQGRTAETLRLLQAGDTARAISKPTHQQTVTSRASHPLMNKTMEAHQHHQL